VNCTYLPTSMVQNTSSEANSYSFSQEIPYLSSESKGSSQCSQESTTGSYPEQDESSPHFPPYSNKIQANIIFPSIPTSSEWSLLFRFSDQNFVSISHWNKIYTYYSSNRSTICHILRKYVKNDSKCIHQS